MKIGITCLIALLMYAVIRQEYYLWQWYKLDTFYSSNKIETYEKLSVPLSQHLNFMHYYAQNRIDEKQFLEADSLLVLLSKRNPNNPFFLIWGETKLMLKDTSAAIDKFLTASYMIPNTVEPKFRLFDVYLQQHDTLNAKIWASKIVNQKIKVPSFYTEGWQLAAKRFLKVQ